MSSVIPDPAVTDWIPLGYGAVIQSNVPASRVYRNTVQSISYGASTALSFTTERFDTDNIYDVSAPTRLTCRTAGKYLIGGNVEWASAAGNVRELYIRLNGGIELAYQDLTPPGTLESITTAYDLAVGDYVELCVYQNQTAGTALNINSVPARSPEFWMTYIGPGLLGRGVQNITGTYLTRPAANAVPPGSTYFAYDSLGTWLSDGSQWFLIAQRPAFGAGSILGQAPWSTPYDGMEVLITDSFANPAFNWHFRYNSGSSSAYKWECLGGAPYVNYSAAQQTVSAVNTWQNIVASAISPPRGGEYVCQAAVQASHPLAGTTAYVALWAGSVPAGVFGPTMAFGWPVAGGYSGQFTIGPYKATLSAGVGVGVAAYNNAAGGAFSLIQYSLMPTRIS